MGLLPKDETIIIGYRGGKRLCIRGRQGVRPAPKYLEVTEFFDFLQL